MAETKQTNTQWVFLPIHKSRIIKEGETYVLVKCCKDTTTILPKVFKRKKESEECIYFSLPSNFQINARCSKLVDEKWEYEDNLFGLDAFDKYVYTLKNLGKPLED